MGEPIKYVLIFFCVCTLYFQSLFIFVSESPSIFYALQLHCCPEYGHFIQLHLANADDFSVEDELIDITPHAALGGQKTIRKANRERVADRYLRFFVSIKFTCKIISV